MTMPAAPPQQGLPQLLLAALAQSQRRRVPPPAATDGPNGRFNLSEQLLRQLIGRPGGAGLRPDLTGYPGAGSSGGSGGGDTGSALVYSQLPLLLTNNI